MTNSARSLPQTLALLAGLLAGCALPAAAGDGRGALGSQGELYQTVSGAYSDIFPGSRPPRGLQGDSQVLALEILRPGAAARRVLIPNPANSVLESAPSLLYEDDAKTLYALWSSRLSSLNSVLYLAGFDGTGWSEPIQLMGNPFASKFAPRLAETRDTYADSSVKPPAVHHRTVLHLAWAEENAASQLEINYAPLIFEDGSFLGFDPHAVTNLNRLAPGRASGALVSSDLVAALNVQSGRDDRIVVVSFAAVTTGELVTAEIDVLPHEVSLIADRVRDQIKRLGPMYLPARVLDLADQVSAGVVSEGAAFHPEVLKPIADNVRDWIIADAGKPPDNASDDVRAQLVDFGFKLTDRGLKTATAQSAVAAPGDRTPGAALPAGGADAVSVEINGSGSYSSQWIQFRLDARRSLPPVGTTGVNILSSKNGENALIEWQLDLKHLLYVTSQGSGWSDPIMVELSEKLSLDQALSLLQQRLR